MMIVNMKINKEQTAEKSIHGILGASENFRPIIHQSIIGYKSGKLTRNCHFHRHYDMRWSWLTLIVGFWSNFSGDPAVRQSF